MCGIAGIHVQDGRCAAEVALVHDMLDALAHRGPDDHGVHADPSIVLGNRRLSIIDPAGGHQPVTNEDGRIVVVSNGEIYNHRELAAGLRRRGHILRSGCDTEVLVHLYEEVGDDLVHHLRGMFAFALWDLDRGRLLLARDRLGIKPLYFTEQGTRLAFASEIKALLVDRRVARRLDQDALVQYLRLKYVPAPGTLFEGVAALPPGHLLVRDDAGTHVRQWWDLSFAPAADDMTDEEHVTELQSLLISAVRSHLVSDVPYGAFLSGGLDSSTVVAIMSQLLEHPVRTFSVGYDGDAASFSELPYARLVADRFGTDHHEVIVRAEDLVDRLPEVVWHLDQPIADEACLPNYLVSELAARHVKMVLTGEGGDELFAGYARYAGERLSPLARAVPAPARRALLAGARRLPGLRRPKIALGALGEPDDARRLTAWFPLFDEAGLRTLLATDLARELPAEDAAVAAVRHRLSQCDSGDALSRMLYLDTKHWLPDDLLARGDKTSMASSLEARVPLLDHPLVEHAASLPSRLKIHGRTRKYLLRRAAEAWVPPEILARPKKGFPTPVSLWFRTGARDLLRDHLAPARVRERGLLDAGTVARLLREHDSGFADHGSLLFGLLSLELWMSAHLDEPVQAAGPANAGAPG